MKKINRITLRLLVAVYIAVSAPLVVLFLWNSHIRNTVLNVAAHYRSRVDPVFSCHLGDSITAGGGAGWSSRIGQGYLNAYNLGVDGHTTHLIRHQVAKALRYKPEWICVLAGTNDLGDARYSVDFTANEFRSLISEISKSGTNCLITLIPYQATRKHERRIAELNLRIREIASEFDCRVVDVNPVIAPDNVLADEFRIDEIHFSPAAYEVWGKLIAKAIGKPN